MVRRVVGSLHWVTTGKAKEGIFTRVLNDGTNVDEPDDDKHINTIRTNENELGKETNEAEESKEAKEMAKGEAKEAAKEVDKDTHENHNEARRNQRKKHRGSKVSIFCDTSSSFIFLPSFLPSIPPSLPFSLISTKMPKKARKEYLGPASPARGLWLEKVWYEEGWCVQPELLHQNEFTPFVDCSFSCDV